jgi:hypothetical protein
MGDTMSTSTVAVFIEQKRASLQAAVDAHLAYLAALDALEELYVAPGAMGDKQSEDLGHLVATLADARLAAGNVPGAQVDARHVANLDSIFE